MAFVDPYSNGRYLKTVDTDTVFWEFKGTKYAVGGCEMCGPAPVPDPCKAWVLVDQAYIDTLENGAAFECGQADVHPAEHVCEPVLNVGYPSLVWSTQFEQ